MSEIKLGRRFEAQAGELEVVRETKAATPKPVLPPPVKKP